MSGTKKLVRVEENGTPYSRNLDDTFEEIDKRYL